MRKLIRLPLVSVSSASSPRYELSPDDTTIAGHARLRADRELGVSKVPVIGATPKSRLTDDGRREIGSHAEYLQEN